MLDVDILEEDYVYGLIERIEQESHKPKCILKHRSMNCWHVVIQLFNPAILEGYHDAEVKKEGVLALDYVGFDD